MNRNKSAFEQGFGGCLGVAVAILAALFALWLLGVMLGGMR